MSFTADEQALIDQWQAEHAATIQHLQDLLVIVQADLIKTQTEKSIYQTKQAEAIFEQNAILVTKAAVLQAANPDPDGDTILNPRFVEYVTGHPDNNGTDPTAWAITYYALPGDIRTVEYSHAVGWQSDMGIIDAEYKWRVFYDWQTNEFYGTDNRINGLDAAVTQLTKEITAVRARDAQLRNVENVEPSVFHFDVSHFDVDVFA